MVMQDQHNWAVVVGADTIVVSKLYLTVRVCVCDTDTSLARGQRWRDVCVCVCVIPTCLSLQAKGGEILEKPGTAENARKMLHK